MKTMIEKEKNLIQDVTNPLEQCLTKLKILFLKNLTDTMTFDSILSDLGYSEKSGGGRHMIASMKNYGILVEEPFKKLKIADFIIDYCNNGILTKELIEKCFLNVPAYKKIFSSYNLNDNFNMEVLNNIAKQFKYSSFKTATFLTVFEKNINLYRSINTVNNYINSITKKHSIISNNEKTLTYPLGSGNEITLILPSNINDLDNNDAEDIKDILEILLKKLNKQVGA